MAEFKSYRPEREKEIIDHLEKAMERVGYIVEDQAKINVSGTMPSGHPKIGETGRLIGSITHKVEKSANEISVLIGTNVEYGKSLEFGHIQHPGQFVPRLGKRLVAEDVPAYPWLFPAVEMKRNEIIKEIGEFKVR